MRAGFHGRRAVSGARGFTLIELIVVICIIALLLGLLIPAIGRMSTHAMSTQCMNNLRTMARAATLYAIEHDAQFPRALFDLFQSRLSISETLLFPSKIQLI